ncbi:hypothetical protein EII31_04695 [Leucobacter sp. OH2974_COT-288]|nr:hypothetical protein EII31_04695 [Leucobacter sp. OH2974_COT-288]
MSSRKNPLAKVSARIAATATVLTLLASNALFGPNTALALDSEPEPNPEVGVEQPAEQTPDSGSEDQNSTDNPADTGSENQLGESAFFRAPANTGRSGAPSVAIEVVSDGTPDAGNVWSADDNPGNDSGANNGIVRVNDTIRYRVNYAVAGGPGNNTTVTVALPRGAELAKLPALCSGPGSSLTPQSISDRVTVPLTANSKDQLEVQTLVCNLGNLNNDSKSFEFDVKISNLLHHGDSITPGSVTVKTDQASTPVPAQSLPTTTASARLMWDVSKNSVLLTENGGYKYGPAVVACNFDTSRVCFMTRYNLLLSAPAGGKGAMPAIGDIYLEDNLTPEAMYPQLSSQQLAALKADLNKYGSRVRTTFETNGAAYERPFSKLGGAATAVNSVRDSGRVKVVQPGPGEPVQITISDADTTLKTYPTQVANPTGKAIPSKDAYAVSYAFEVHTPTDVVRDFGVESNNVWTLNTVNKLDNMRIGGFNPVSDVQTSADQPGPNATKYPGTDTVHWNDYMTTQPNLSVSGVFSKRFVGISGQPGNVAPVDFNAGDRGWMGEGPPGGATFGSGGITVAPTQSVTSLLTIHSSNAALPASQSIVACDVWDNTKLYLQARQHPGDPNTPGRYIGSDGEAVWITGYNNLPLAPNGRLQYADKKSQVPEIKVQYSAAGTAGAGTNALCDDSQGPWYDNPNDPALGNDSALAAQGIYTGVKRVRVHFVSPPAVGAHIAFVRYNIAIGMYVADAGHPTGELLPNWATTKRLTNFVGGNQEYTAGTVDEVIAANKPWSRNTYDYNGHTGAIGDRLILAHAQARVSKLVRVGDSGDFTKTPPNVTGGNKVQYQITPSLTSGASTTGILKDVWVEDCLPGSQDYLNAVPAPQVVSSTTPGDAKRPACAADETYLRWEYPKHEVNQAIEPIILEAEVSSGAPNGVYTNKVQVWAQDDNSTEKQRSDSAQVQISNVAGVKLEKVLTTPVRQVLPENPDFTENIGWRVRLINALPAAGGPTVTNPDIIDVLPKNGLHDSKFSGKFAFESAKPTARSVSTMRLLYTSAQDIALDPRDPSNQQNGSTTWCDAPANGNPVYGSGACPADASEVTGLRAISPGTYRVGEILEFDVTAVATGNAAGDIYDNVTFAAAQGLQFPVGPIHRQTTVVGSSIGDYVWWDYNRNGVQDNFEGEPEKPAGEIIVELYGRDDLGNDVNLQTRTDGTGHYRFENLRASDNQGYQITFTAPSGTTFTQKLAGNDTALDSNVDANGRSDAIKLPRDTNITDVDAGLLTQGSLKITKLLEGAGVKPFAGGNQLTFDVSCTLDSQPVFNKTVNVAVPAGVTSVDSEQLNDIPAMSKCVITETSQGTADAAATPVTVVVGANMERLTTASLTNYYSAGTVEVAKVLEGNDTALAAAAAFEVMVTCQVPGVGGAAGATVASQLVKFTGAGSKKLLADNGEPVYLPLGAKCFASEPVNGGAAEVVISHDSFANGAEVVGGKPTELQELSLQVTNKFELPKGELKITKLLEGAGVKPFAGGTELEFGVVCTFEGAEVRNETVKVAVPAGATSVESAVLGDLPASAKCVITEVAAPGADELAAPVTVTIPWDAAAWTSGLANASLTNYYSAGTLTKEVTGEAAAVEKVKDAKFKIMVTCQVPENGKPVTVHSQEVEISDGQTVLLADAAGEAQHLPLGAKCFINETVTGGAAEVITDHNSFENGVEVTAGTPEELQELAIKVTNKFVCNDELCPQPIVKKLSITGNQLAGGAGIIGGILLVIAGVVFYLVRRRKQD